MRRTWMMLSGAIIVVAAVLVAGCSSNNIPAPETRSPRSSSMEVMLGADPQVRSTVHRACYNCHSDQPRYPWYASVWPSSSLVHSDRQTALARLNFSQWDRLSPEMSKIRLLDACAMMTDNKMPLWYYRPLHPEARLSAQEVQHFCAWAHSLNSMAEAR